MAHVRRGRAQVTAGRAGGRGGALGGGVRSAALGDVGLARRGPGRDGTLGVLCKFFRFNG